MKRWIAFATRAIPELLRRAFPVRRARTKALWDPVPVSTVRRESTRSYGEIRPVLALAAQHIVIRQLGAIGTLHAFAMQDILVPREAPAQRAQLVSIKM